MENDTLLKGVRIPEQGFIEIQISSDGNVILTGESVRCDNHDYYRPVGPALIGSAIPAMDAVEVVHGEWKDTGSGQVCSACDEFQPGYDNYRFFCAHCGARMDGQRKEDGLYQSLKRGLEEAIAYEKGEIELRTERREDGDA